MAERTAIAWTNSTFNPWIGCEAISPGCKNCYAAAYAKRVGRDFATRTRTAEAYWKQPLKWNREAAARSTRWLVFCASLADVFDNDVPLRWRQDLMDLVADTPHLTWLFLTKRIGMARRMLGAASDHRSFFLTANDEYKPPQNLWIGATIVNQEEADRDVPKLLATPAAKRFVSYEPALGPVDWTKFPGIDWIIVGGESGHHARRFDWDWARSTIAQARQIGAAPFMKQTGTDNTALYEREQKARNGDDPAEWPEDLRVQEFPQ